MSVKSKPSTEGFLEVAEIEEALRLMEEDSSYNTISSYSANVAHLDHQIPFSEKHLLYLKNHPRLNPEHYLANLRLMMKVRS
jgi:hypothetical protein